MLHLRKYHCKSCGQDFVSSDGVIRLASSGVKCTKCQSTDTHEVSIGLMSPIAKYCIGIPLSWLTNGKVNKQ